MLGAAVEALAALLAAQTGHVVAFAEQAAGEGIRLRLDADGLWPDPLHRSPPSADPGRPQATLLPWVLRLRLTADGATLPARLEALEAAANALTAALLEGDGWQAHAWFDAEPNGVADLALHLRLRVSAR